MSECRSITNFMGNAVATVVVSRWDNALDQERLRRALNGDPDPGLLRNAGLAPGDVHAD